MNRERRDQVIIPPKTLQAKVPKTGGPSMAEMVRNAEVGLRKIKANYEAVVQTELRKIDDAISRAIDTPTSAADVSISGGALAVSVG